MSPFDQYLLEAKEIREHYNILIEEKPAQKDQLLAEMKELLQKKLDECEQKEIERSKHL